MMKQLFILCSFCTFLACTSREQTENKVDSTKLALEVKNDSQITTSVPEAPLIIKSDSADYVISTYDDQSFGEYHKESLKELSEEKVFSVIHGRLLSALPKTHQEYFTSNSDL